MNPTRTKTQNQRRSWGAVAFALGVHIVLLGVLGLNRPHFAPRPVDDIPDIQIQLERRPETRPKAVVPVPIPPTKATRVEAKSAPPSQAQAPAPLTPAIRQARTAGPAANQALEVETDATPPGCATEDLIVLTEQEKAHCREAIEVLRQRRAAAAAEAERAARVAAIRQGPKFDIIDPEKRVQYDNAVNGKAANQANFDAFTSGTGGKGMHCSLKLGRGRTVAAAGSTQVGPLSCAP